MEAGAGASVRVGPALGAGIASAVAPWWAENPKEAYNSGVDALTRGWMRGRSPAAVTARGAGVGFQGSTGSTTRGHGVPTDARLQDCLVRVGSGCSTSVFPVQQDVLGVWWAKSEPDPRRPDLRV